MASECEATCDEDPNFAVICAFLEKFGQAVGVTNVDFQELQAMLENTFEASEYLVELHVKLLRKIRKNVHLEKWEKCLIKFCHTFSSVDAWEVERFGYKKAKLSSKLRILKELLEMQFDFNAKFRTELKKLTSKELRSQPLGRDKFGHSYWFHSDDNYQIRVYKEDLDDEKWILVAKDREGLASLIATLNDGEIKISSDSGGNEDSNSLSEKPIIDTGQQDNDSKKTSEDEEVESIDKKRPREETDEDLFQKYKIKNLEIVVSDIAKKPIINEGVDETIPKTEEAIDEEPIGEGVQEGEEEAEKLDDKESPVVGEEIEEPVIKVEGEGSGVDNESPICGEVIEEEVIFFYGGGSGAACLTGNESEKGETEIEKPVETDKVCSEAEDEVDCPQKPKSSVSITKSCIESEIETNNDTTVNSVEKELDTVNSPSPKGEIDTVDTPSPTEKIDKEEESNEEKEEELVKEEQESSRNGEIIQEKPTDNNTVNNKEKKASDAVIEEEIIKEDPAERVENDKKETDVNINNSDREIKLNESKENQVEQKPPIEPICIKRSAYICGKEEKRKMVIALEKIDSNDVELDNKVSKRGRITRSRRKNNYKESNGIKEENHLPQEHSEDSKTSDDKELTVKPEVVLVSDLTEIIEEPEVRQTRSRLVRKAVKRKATSSKRYCEPKTKVNSGSSSVANSPAVESVSDNVADLDDAAVADLDDAAVAVPEDDPLAVDEPQTRSRRSATLSSFSLDFNDSEPSVSVPVISARTLRKRGREDNAQKAQEVDNGPEKRIKLKVRRQVDTALRKSVEQRIEQLKGSSSESKESDVEKQASKTPRIKKKKKQDYKPKKPPNPEKKNSRILLGLEIAEDDNDNDKRGPRQSRRIAQMKIKEQMDVNPVDKPAPKEEVFRKKSSFEKPEKRKRNKPKEEVVSEPEVIVERKRRRRKKKEKPLSRLFNEKRPWQSSTDDSDEAPDEEEEEEDAIEEEEEPPLGDLKSDHEFSPESDLENDEELQPLKRARTARKESDQEDVDDFPCQKCNKLDHPEWILLCDKCDTGWHCSCLRPPLLVIPEGDWFCPPCQHVNLLEQLQAKLVEYDKKLSKKEIEDRRKERLAYVGISLNNVLPTKEPAEHRKKKWRDSSSSSEESSDYSDSDSDEPIYQLRQRRQARSYKFNEYDEMMKTAIGEELDRPEDTAGNLGRGKDIQTIVKGLEPEPKAPENSSGGRPTLTNLQRMLRKKHRKLNSLEIDSEEEDISDEDFKGSSSESEEEEEDESAASDDSDDFVGRKRRKNLPVRRSTRARTKRYDSDFIDDDTDDDAPKRKKKRAIWDDSESESDTSGWGGGRKGKKKKRNRNRDRSGEGRVKKGKARIKYGGLTSSDEDLGRGRRTRGKKATYVDTLGSDSEDAAVVKKNPRRIESDDDEDEDFVANEDDVDEGDKVSDDNEEEAQENEEEEEEDSERERREKRSLLVPKIYIKKPLGVKKLDPTPRSFISDISKKHVAASINKDPVNSAAISTENGTKSAPNQTNPQPHPNVEVKEPAKSQDEPENLVTQPSSAREGVSAPEAKQPATAANNNPLVLAKRGRESQQESMDQPEPIVSNVMALIKNADENDDLSEPPGISLPLFDELPTASGNGKDGSSEDAHKKRRGPPKKKSLEETLANIGSKNLAKVLAETAAIEIAAPPQPFSQSQPAPSIITRMLQAKPGQATVYPVGTIRPKQFATMKDDDSSDESSKGSRGSSPAPAPYGLHGALRTTIGSPYRSQAPPHHISMNHYPRAPPLRAPPLPHVPSNSHGPPPTSHGPTSNPYQHHTSHRSMDPSPSGGGPINLADPSPGPPPVRYQPSPSMPVQTRHLPQPQPYPPSSQPTSTSRSSESPLPQPPPSEGYYGSYPPAPLPPPPPNEETLPPSSYQGMPSEGEPPYSEQYAGEETSRGDAPSENSKGYDEESGGGEFAGLASYFSSQREDDLDS